MSETYIVYVEDLLPELQAILDDAEARAQRAADANVQLQWSAKADAVRRVFEVVHGKQCVQEPLEEIRAVGDGVTFPATFKAGGIDKSGNIAMRLLVTAGHAGDALSAIRDMLSEPAMMTVRPAQQRLELDGEAPGQERIDAVTGEVGAG